MAHGLPARRTAQCRHPRDHGVALVLLAGATLFGVLIVLQTALLADVLDSWMRR